MDDLERLAPYLADPKWRLNNLYWIGVKDGGKVLFKFNKTQEQIYNEMWSLNIILKARQLGISTFVCLYFLDICLFKSNIAAGIIAHTREDAEHLFKRIKFAYDQLPDEFKRHRTATVDSARELVFNNHSSLRVGTSMRSSTLQYLHISEFGKICARYPEKAAEIISGSLNAVAPGQHVFIESTAEGREGHFYELCQQAEAMQIANKKLSSLDYRFHFFPWYECSDYVLDDDITIPKEVDNYFFRLQGKGIKLTQEQKNWYYKTLSIQRTTMKREFPSCSEEAFESAVEGKYYAQWIAEARVEERFGRIPYDKSVPVYVAFDPGFNDQCAIVFFQLVAKEIHVIDYYENNKEGLAHYIGIIKSKPYIYEKYFGPHDIEAHHISMGLSVKEVAASMGIALITLPTLKTGLRDGIEAVRSIFSRLWVDEKNCARLIKCLENYKKEFDLNFQIYKDKPVHDEYSHGADAFRYAAIAIKGYLDSGGVGITEKEAERLYEKHNPRFN